MAQINGNLGRLNVNNLASAKGTQTKKEDLPEPKETIQELVVVVRTKNGVRKIFDNGKNDVVKILNEDFVRIGEERDMGQYNNTPWMPGYEGVGQE